MSGNNKQINKEEACTIQYLKDCERIERQQDEINEQRKLLEDTDEQMQLDAKTAYERLNEYADTKDTQLYQLMTECQNEIHQAQAQAYKHIESDREELASLDRKLAHELEEREKTFKVELKNLSKENENETSRKPAETGVG